MQKLIKGIVLFASEFLIFYLIQHFLSNKLATLSLCSIVFLIFIPLNFDISKRRFLEEYLKILSSACLGFSLAFLLLISTYLLLTSINNSLLASLLFLSTSLFSLFLIFLFLASTKFKGGIEPRVKKAWACLVSRPRKFMKGFLLFSLGVALLIDLAILGNEVVRSISFSLLLLFLSIPSRLREK